MNKRKQYYDAGAIYSPAEQSVRGTNPAVSAGTQLSSAGSLLGEAVNSFVNSQAGKDIVQGFSVAAGGPTNEQVDTFAYKVNENKKARDKGMDEPFPTPASDLTGIGGEGQTGPTAMQRWAERTRQPTQSVAMALQRMSSGVGAHPGGAGRGKGAGGSLGQESRQAMKRKRLSKRIANKKTKGKDQIQLSADAPKIRDDYDYAEGGRVTYQEGGMMEEQMSSLMEEQMLAESQAENMAQETMIPDEQMENDYTDFIIGESLTPEDEEYLLTALEQDDRLSMIFDQVVETASEFTGSGPVEGPGTGMSDSIPARLSDGEFVITSKATEEIGPDKLQGMMEQAEMDADVRQMRQAGGYVTETEEEQEEQEIVRAVQPKETQGRVMPRSLADKKVNESMIALNPRNSLFAT